MSVPVTPSNPTTNSGYLKIPTVTIAASGVAQPLSVTTIACIEFIIQVPFGGAKIRIGGPEITTTTGVELDPPASATLTPDAFSDYIDDLKKVYVIGTIGTVLTGLYRTL